MKNQAARAKTGLREIYKTGLRKKLVIDDETYVFIDPEGTQGRKFYHVTGREDVEYDANSKPTAKLAKTYCFGPFHCTGTMTPKVYLSDCLKKRLIPFTKAHHKIEVVVFRPDLTTSHYSREVTHNR